VAEDCQRVRGVSILTGLALAVEVGDCNRFTSNMIRSFVGLVPSEFALDRRGRWADHPDREHNVRRLLVEAA
jgi:hypothetical protein